MLIIEPGATLHPSKIGHYGIHYPDFTTTVEITERLEVKADVLPLLCFEDRTFKAFKISTEQAERWGLSLPIIWAKA